MANKISLFESALREILAEATEPLTSNEIREKAALWGVEASTTQVAIWLYNLMRRKRNKVPLARVPVSQGHTLFAYYNPQVIQPLAYGPRPEPVNTVNSQPVEEAPVEEAPVEPVAFNPVAFAHETATSQVTVPEGVRSIQLNVAGVSIRIELTS